MRVDSGLFLPFAPADLFPLLFILCLLHPVDLLEARLVYLRLTPYSHTPFSDWQLIFCFSLCAPTSRLLRHRHSLQTLSDLSPLSCQHHFDIFPWFTL